MRTFTLLLFGLASYVEPNKCNPQTGEVSQKGPPEINTFDLALLNGADGTISYDGTNNFIIASMLMGKVSRDELSGEASNRTTTHIRKLNQSDSYKTYCPDIITKTNNFNQI